MTDTIDYTPMSTDELEEIADMPGIGCRRMTNENDADFADRVIKTLSDRIDYLEDVLIALCERRP